MSDFLDDLLAGIREVGEAFMDDDAIAVYRYTDDVYEWSDDLLEDYDYGDDEVDFTEPELHGSETFVGSFKAWVVSKIDRTVDRGDGALVMVHDQVIRVPVGSDIRERDVILIRSTGEVRSVLDSNTPDTHPEWMKIVLRGGE